MTERAEILVADDDPDIREVISLVLEAHGFRTVGAGDGTEVLTKIRTNPEIGLVLLDLMMPRLSGADTVKAIRADAQFRGLPVVILSGDNGAGHLAAELGVTEYLRKPVDLEKLLATVVKYVQP